MTFAQRVAELDAIVAKAERHCFTACIVETDSMRALLTALRESQQALNEISQRCSEHPMYLGEDATDELIAAEGGDAANITYLEHVARTALSKWRIE